MSIAASVNRSVSVAIPVYQGAALLDRTLAAVRAQRRAGPASVELLVCDSGSRDGSVAIARHYGAEVIEIPPEQFSHGDTRNLLMRRSQGSHVAFLTQDSVPADESWLETLIAGFSLGDDVALAFGPYHPRADASPMVARELIEWFTSFSPDGRPRVDRLAPSERSIAARELLARRGFFTDANGCVARAAWESVPFRSVPYAEDHFLAHDMLRAGYAKAYVPDAGVIHSHEYSSWNWVRRSFDEARALKAVYGFVEPLELVRTPLKVWGLVGADWRWGRTRPSDRTAGPLLARSLAYHLLRTTGALIGSRAERLPRAAERHFSLEGTGEALDTLREWP